MELLDTLKVWLWLWQQVIGPDAEKLLGDFENGDK